MNIKILTICVMLLSFISGNVSNISSILNILPSSGIGFTNRFLQEALHAHQEQSGFKVTVRLDTKKALSASGGSSAP